MEDLRILIVDDIPTNVALIAAIIKKLNARQETAGNGEEALSLIDSFKPHIVLLDLMMPGIDGWDIIKAIREKYSKEQMAIIVTSAITDYETITECKNNGVDDFITKPIMPDMLLNSIQLNALKFI
ncbi:response regulator [uncultured Prevotella sp.]|uniref:response regulator n=1 Tax=uncultured Prevotella sp. TaxID=159272 RepID=UPI002635A5B2|nr:response regulator [uncultured Prevotella sp.]